MASGCVDVDVVADAVVSGDDVDDDGDEEEEEDEDEDDDDEDDDDDDNAEWASFVLKRLRRRRSEPFSNIPPHLQIKLKLNGLIVTSVSYMHVETRHVAKVSRYGY